MALYGAQSATTTLPCIATVLSTPLALTTGIPGTLTAEQRNFIVANYLPFFVIPLFMAVHCGTRVARMIKSEHPRPKQN